MFKRTPWKQPMPGDAYVDSIGGDAVIGFEQARLGLDARQPTAGLALSGGGVRSASFALGVLQALMARLRADPARSPDPMDRFHYLSTVSGGGYLGLALLWLRARERVQPNDPGYRRHFLGKNRGARSELQGIWLDYFRQHGSYLMPRGVGLASLLGVALRTLLFCAGVYFGIAVVLLALAGEFGVLGAASSRPTCDHYAGWTVCTAIDAPSLLAFTSAAIVAVSVVFALGTFVVSYTGLRKFLFATVLGALVLYAADSLFAKHVEVSSRVAMGMLGAIWGGVLLVLMMLARFLLQRRAAKTASPGWSARAWQRCTGWLQRGRAPSQSPPLEWVVNAAWAYRVRLDVQALVGALLAVSLLLVVLASLPHAYALIETRGPITAPSLLTLLGLAGSYYQGLAGRAKREQAGMVSTLRILLTAAALAYGLLLGAYVLAVTLQPAPTHLAIAAIALLLLGTLVNLNLLGLGRMYRDRLMETFLPDDESIDSNGWEPASRADGDQGLLLPLWEATGARGLYPLANTNVVLVDAMSDKYRNRGGDSFLLSPLYCGSDATGWVRTERFADGQLSAASAMATSGAAANPNSGPGGRGVTRNRLVSFLMFFVQARLGLWVSNPLQAGNGTRFGGIGRLLPPNLVHPGIVSGLFGRRLKENTAYVELSDGGHFDNTGLYELVRRRVKLIVLAQASADPDYAMADLANAIEKIRVDFGVHLRFNHGIALDGIPPSDNGSGPGAGRLYAKRGYAIARIDYPATHGSGKREYGWLLYLQATPVKQVPGDVHAYYRACPAFPNESTADQFFDEVQLEAYRELGYAIGKQMLRDVSSPAFAVRRMKPWLRRCLGI